MRILFVTICLDGMPFLPLIWTELRKLPKEIQWNWHVIEGTATPKHCTRWVSAVTPRLSRDGTTEFMEGIVELDRRVKHTAQLQWNGKIEMVNYPLDPNMIPMRTAYECDKCKSYNEPFLLWQMDSDELWTWEQIVDVWWMFKDEPEKNAAFFWCRYFVGIDKVITTRNCFGNNSAFEWLRVWKVKPGMLFKTHEPPVIEGLKLNPFSHTETEARGLVFEHFSWCTRAQVEFKSAYYSGANNPNARHYKGLVERWEKFQQEKTWPRPLKELFPFAEPFAMVSKSV